MTHPVSSISSLSATVAAQAAQAPRPPKQTTTPPQDTVHLSQAALKAAGDADHDGDSH